MQLREINEKEFEKFAKKHEQITFHQTKQWADLKSFNGWKSYFVGLENNKKLEGTTVEVLVESQSDKPGYVMGYSDTNKLVNIKGEERLIGKIVKVKIIEAKTWSLNGEYID